MTERLSASNIKRAANLLKGGGLVAFPTETVYGLGARADDDQAIASIFEAKNRPRFNPLIVHVPSLEIAQIYAHFDDTALALAQNFWPGPMTLVLPLRAEAKLSSLITAGHQTVAIRVPGHPLALELLSEVGLPIAAPSANPSGSVSPTTADHVLEGLGGRISAVLDGGSCPVGLESSIVVTQPLSILRPGGVSKGEIERAMAVTVAQSELSETAPIAPGQLKSHYAPSSKLRLNASTPQKGELLLGFGDVQGASYNLSPGGNIDEAAANLFAMLRLVDKLAAEDDKKTIAVSPIPMTGLGVAINDRLVRAAAPRP